jgi:prepilin-type N-terminal cleavage/methylation domain-containing protein/prepilin-type processing-associated H-X9-DG protein
MSSTFPNGFKVSRLSSDKRGFTLVEILVVLAILAVLAAMLFPLMARTTDSGHQAKCVNNLRQMGVAIFSFAADNGGALPSASSPMWTTQIWPYVYPGKEPPKTMPSTKLPAEFIGTIFCCPAASKEEPRVRDYAFNYRIGDGDTKTRDRLVTLSRASQHALVADAARSSGLDWSNIKARHGGNKANVLYADGHVDATEVAEETMGKYRFLFWGTQKNASQW